MALQVWLPLNGDLKNKGCADVTVTNNGATIDNNGKIGKCYSFGANGYMTLPSLNTTKSICFWLKSPKTNSTIAFVDYKSKLGFGFYSNYIIVTCAGYSVPSYTTDGFIANNWNHIALVKTNNDVLLYINGALQTSRTTSNQWSNTVDFCYIGRRSTGYPITGYMNDFRVYDHYLSPTEVKEISKGLVLHYKLDDNYQTLDNCYAYPTFNTSTATGGWSHLAPSGSSGTYSQNTNREYIFNRNQTYSHKVSCAEGSAYYICYQSPAFEGGYRSAQAIIKLPDGEIPDTSKIYWSANALVIAPTTKFTYLRDGFYLMQAEGFNQNGTNDLVSILLRSGVTVYISEAYLENDKKLCSDLFNQNSNTVQDSSGYNNNSTITGELLLNSESPRYKNCIAFTNSSYLRSIDKVATFLPTDAITVNLWIKYSTWGNPISCTQGGGWNFEETSNGIQFPLYVSGVGYKTANSGITSATLANSYHMLTGTFDKTNVKIYIDGELKATTATNSTNGIGYANNYLFISAEAQGDTITPASSTFVGNISDVRIYATALSAEDIRQLYEVSGKIDNLGNLYSYEFIEEDTYKPIAQKNGIIKINNFIEQYNYLYLPSGTFINTELNYNAGDSCKAETVIRYESGGSGRDLMGYSTSGAGYWGVKANGNWEPHGTFTYTNTDITVKNNISYIFSSATEHGVYLIGALANLYTVRNKYIYHVKLYKNDILERDLYPAKQGNSIGLFDMITKKIYTPNNSNAILGYDDQNTAKLFKDSIKSTEFIEI